MRLKKTRLTSAKFVARRAAEPGLRFRKIDMESYKRRQHFEYFRAMRNPYVGVTAEADITEMYHWAKAGKRPLFLSILYAASRAANRIAEFRQRARGEEIVEYAWCPTSHTVALEDGTYCYCQLRSDMPFAEFLPYAQREQALASRRKSMEDGEGAEALFFVSCLPWLSYTALVQPTPEPADYNPRMTFGRAFGREGRTLLPVTLLANHALVDGRQIADFFAEFEKEAGRMASCGN